LAGLTRSAAEGMIEHWLDGIRPFEEWPLLIRYRGKKKTQKECLRQKKDIVARGLPDWYN
jgi:hypothetical protein